MKKVYVVGNNTKNSLSPAIFSYWFAKYNINAKYSYLEINPHNFDKEIEKILNEAGVCGLNITIPFKERILGKLDRIDVHSKRIGAVNFITKNKLGWFGKNTDWTGFLNSIKHSKKKISTDSAMVLGYGGASKAIIYALEFLGFNEIYLHNRTYKKIKHLESNRKIRIINANEVLKKIDKTNIIINTTPVDIIGPAVKKIITNNVMAFDAVYKPKDTGFLSHFKKNNSVYGILMLVYQAAPCFEEWFGIKPAVDKKLLEMLDRELSK